MGIPMEMRIPWESHGMEIDDKIGNGKEWETTCMGMEMALIPIQIDFHQQMQC